MQSCHSGPDPESQSSSIEILNQVQDDMMQSCHSRLDPESRVLTNVDPESCSG
ncbi:MAG: hypothetical protein AB1444_07030 [Spirochaetota bacterium]